MYIYLYICVCSCACACVWARAHIYIYIYTNMCHTYNYILYLCILLYRALIILIIILQFYLTDYHTHTIITISTTNQLITIVHIIHIGSLARSPVTIPTMRTMLPQLCLPVSIILHHPPQQAPPHTHHKPHPK